MSTEDAAFRQTDSVLKSINQKIHVGRIFCDLAKASDCMNHVIFQLNYISMEYEEYLKIDSGPI